MPEEQNMSKNEKRPEESAMNKERTGKMVLYVGIFSICMLFAGLTSAYIVSSHNDLWVNISMPVGFYISTVIILASSLTIKLAVNASKKGNASLAKILLAVTIILGVGFSISQYSGWQQLIGKGSYFSGHVDNLNGVYGEDYTIKLKGQELVFEEGQYFMPSDDLKEKPLNNEISIYSNSASSYIYVLSFTHVLHVLGGMIYLIVLFLLPLFGKNKAVNQLNLKLGSIYWHFVDGLWVYLFLFLLLFH